ncbi:MAG TPA: DUF6328 family protein [Actinomycetales bacterium]|nr:DUF6328 family protein [Actinomycetales bacterium]
MTKSGAVNEVSGRPETEAERLDRNFNELLQELRVAQAGTQILFAFLLTVAFTPYIQGAAAFEHRLLAATLVLAALATVLLIAPVPLHRMMFRQQMKGTIVEVSARLASAGLVLLLLAMLGGCLLALDALLDRTTAYLVTAGVAVWFAAFWLLLPVGLRVWGRRGET